MVGRGTVEGDVELLVGRELLSETFELLVGEGAVEGTVELLVGRRLLKETFELLVGRGTVEGRLLNFWLEGELLREL